MVKLKPVVVGLPDLNENLISAPGTLAQGLFLLCFYVRFIVFMLIHLHLSCLGRICTKMIDERALNLTKTKLKFVEKVVNATKCLYKSKKGHSQTSPSNRLSHCFHALEVSTVMFSQLQRIDSFYSTSPNQSDALTRQNKVTRMTNTVKVYLGRIT